MTDSMAYRALKDAHDLIIELSGRIGKLIGDNVVRANMAPLTPERPSSKVTVNFMTRDLWWSLVFDPDDDAQSVETLAASMAAHILAHGASEAKR